MRRGIDLANEHPYYLTEEMVKQPWPGHWPVVMCNYPKAIKVVYMSHAWWPWTCWWPKRGELIGGVHILGVAHPGLRLNTTRSPNIGLLGILDGVHTGMGMVLLHG